MRGRKPKPAEAKARAGNPGKRPLPQPVTVAGRRAPAPPDDLPPEGRELWDELVPMLEEVGIIDGVDRPMLVALCRQWARAQQAAKILATRKGPNALLTKGSTGQLVEHPALKIEREAHRMLLRFGEQYALTPVGRTRLGLAELKRRRLATDLLETIGSS